MRALAIAFVLVPALAHADIDEKGVRVGLGTFPITRESNDASLNAPSDRSGPSSVSIGSYITLRVASSFALQFEAVFASKGSQAEHCSPCMDVSDLRAYYFELPVLLRFDLLPGQRAKFHLDLGAELAIHLGTVETIPSRTEVDFKPANGGSVVGVGYQLGAGPGRITVDARFIRWFAPLKGSDLANDMSHTSSGNQFSLALGYAFP